MVILPNLHDILIMLWHTQGGAKMLKNCRKIEGEKVAKLTQYLICPLFIIITVRQWCTHITAANAVEDEENVVERD